MKFSPVSLPLLIATLLFLPGTSAFAQGAGKYDCPAAACLTEDRRDYLKEVWKTCDAQWIPTYNATSASFSRAVRNFRNGQAYSLCISTCRTQCAPPPPNKVSRPASRVCRSRCAPNCTQSTRTALEQEIGKVRSLGETLYNECTHSASHPRKRCEVREADRYCSRILSLRNRIRHLNPPSTLGTRIRNAERVLEAARTAISSRCHDVGVEWRTHAMCKGACLVEKAVVVYDETALQLAAAEAFDLSSSENTNVSDLGADNTDDISPLEPLTPKSELDQCPLPPGPGPIARRTPTATATSTATATPRIRATVTPTVTATPRVVATVTPTPAATRTPTPLATQIGSPYPLVTAIATVVSIGTDDLVSFEHLHSPEFLGMGLSNTR